MRRWFPDAQINHYANFHFLRQKDNRNKSDKPPHEWFKSPGQAPAYSDQELAERLISWDILQPGAFPQMLQVRGKRIRDKALSLFHMKSEEEFNALLRA
jgi:hypothetical protein